MTSAYLLSANDYPTTSFGVPRGVTRWGDGARLMAVAAPLTPRPRGTIYEAMPFILASVLRSPPDRVLIQQLRAIIDGKRFDGFGSRYQGRPALTPGTENANQDFAKSVDPEGRSPLKGALGNNEYKALNAEGSTTNQRLNVTRKKWTESQRHPPRPGGGRCSQEGPAHRQKDARNCEDHSHQLFIPSAWHKGNDAGRPGGPGAGDRAIASCISFILVSNETKNRNAGNCDQHYCYRCNCPDPTHLCPATQ
jgi:hypothetical protein